MTIGLLNPQISDIVARSDPALAACDDRFLTRQLMTIGLSLDKYW